MQTVNEVIATGKIIGTGKNGLGYSTITMVIRGIKPAIIKFVVGNLAPEIGIGDNVTVKGYTKAYSYHNEIKDRWVSVQYFVALEIKKNQPDLKERFGVEGRHYRNTFFQAYIAGTVTNTIETNDPNWAKLTVKVDGVGEDKRPSYITLSYLLNHRLPEFDYQRGDEVYISASISTPQKEFEGKVVNFENLIIEDIVKAEAKESE